MKRLLVLTSAMLLAASLSYGQSPAPTGNTRLTLTVGAEALISVDSTDAFSTSSAFTPYTATTNYTYYIRTSASGSGKITVQCNADWTGGTGGPSVASPPTTGDLLSFTSTVSSPGTAVNGSIAALNTAYNIATFGAGAASATNGNSGNSVAWSLTNDPKYAQGSYSITATFTVSSS